MTGRDGLTLQQVLVVCAEAGRPLTESTFRTYVSKGNAPAPAHKEGRVPIWDAEQIAAWAAGELESVNSRHAAELYAQAHVAADASGPLMLHSEHLITLDLTLPTHEAVVKLEKDLTERLGALEDAVTRMEQTLGRRLTTEPEREVDGGTTLMRILRRWNGGRQDRARQAYLDQIAGHLAITRGARDAAAHDLPAVKSWIAGLLMWAHDEQTRRHQQLLSEEVAAERAARELDLTACVTEVEFVRADHRRLAWFSCDRDIDRAQVLAMIDAGHDPQVYLGLGGADFGYRWRHDSTDNPHWRDHAQGSWRVSWIDSTGELYAHSTHHHKVLLLGVTRPTTVETMIAWMLPLESQQSQRNSLALLAAAFREQQEAGFPNLTPPPWAEDPLPFVEAP